MASAWRHLIFLSLSVFILAACQEQTDDVAPLPTLIPSEAPTITVTPTPSVVSTANRPFSLPPTFTPTPTPTITPTATSTATPEPFALPGTMYYIHNQTSIIAQTDIDESQAIFNRPDAILEDLSLSPDGELLAFVAPGNGSAREVFVISTDGEFMQQVSCLGQANIQMPTWSPDGQTVAFYAGQETFSPLDIYSASWVGANNCPSGNNQRQVSDANLESITDLAFSPDGSLLVFSDEVTYAIDWQSGAVSPSLTRTLGFGPDYSYAFNPTNPNQLAYLRSSGQARGTGDLIIIDISTIDGYSDTIFQVRTTIDAIVWNAAGDRILASQQSNLLLFDPIEQEFEHIRDDVQAPSDVLFGPDDIWLAYFRTDIRTPISLFNLETDEQITVQPFGEGIITDVVWAGE